MQNLFLKVASNSQNKNWEQHIKRQNDLYQKKNDIRSPYERDYTRILHSLAYRRLKHKTQVFFNIDNDHICTRMEHVQHVESVSSTISSYLGLNSQLTKAIAIGHDLGHAPFGHEGENELSKIRTEHGLDKFWHEKNGLHMVDNIELLEDPNRNYQNLNLTYAVRDGIISHCGEVDENGLYPRKNVIELSEFKYSGEFQACTWEGCVVKLSDKIAYLGRDIEDAIRVHFINISNLRELRRIANKYEEDVINTTVTIHNFIIDICNNSSPDNGIRLSDKYNNLLDEIKRFNNRTIYKNQKFDVYKKYVSLIIRSIFDILFYMYDKQNTISRLLSIHKSYPLLIKNFLQHLNEYSEIEITDKRILQNMKRYYNKKIYSKLETEQLYVQAILDYISGMTDRYAVTIFNELIHY